MHKPGVQVILQWQPRLSRMNKFAAEYVMTRSRQPLNLLIAALIFPRSLRT